MVEKVRRAMNDSAGLRWGVVVLVSISMMVNYYFYDALSPLKDLLSSELGWTSTHYGHFNAAYAFPNTFLFMAVIGGIIADKLGIRVTGTSFISFMVIGALLTWYGATDAFNDGGPGHAFLSSFYPEWPASLKMMFLGFLFFGLGAETSLVVITKTIVKWFRGRDVALALGINLALGRLGSALAMIVPPRIIEPEWTFSLWLCVVLMAIGLLTFVFYVFIDVRFDREAAEAVAAGDGEEEEPFRLSDIFKLLRDRSFIYIVLLCVTFYSAVFPFMKYAPDLMLNKFGMSMRQSGDIVSLLPLGTILFTPLFGWLVDTKGKGASLMILGSSLLVVVHLLFALTSVTPLVPLFLLGVAFSLVPAAMWPSLAKIVDDRRLGSAYGLTFSVQNFGLWLFPILIGTVLDSTNPGVAEAKAITGALANAREAATALIEADEEETSDAQLATLVGRARDAAEGLGDVEIDGVDGAYTVGLDEARPIATRLARAEEPAAARALSAELVAVETTDRRPLYDYTYTILMLAVLGLFGLLFAFLLRRADRKQGYGLDLPNKTKKAEEAGTPKGGEGPVNDPEAEDSADEDSPKGTDSDSVDED